MKIGRVSLRVLGALFVVLTLGAQAAEVTLDEARRAVGRWLALDPALGARLGCSVKDARTCAPTNNASFHVVRLDGGGFVVLSSDTTREPVVAFSEGDDLEETDANPLWSLLVRDLAVRTSEANTVAAAMDASDTTGGAVARRLFVASGTTPWTQVNEVRWAKLLESETNTLASGGQMTRRRGFANQGVSSISDVRVAPFVKSKWNQGSVGGDYCFNYYTPNHYVCGCVATAVAQIMRYFEWPRSDVFIPPHTCDYCASGANMDNLNSISLTTQGGFFDWSLMPLVPTAANLTDEKRQMIGKLTSDIGIICGMSYTKENGSGTFDTLTKLVFEKFTYSGWKSYWKGNTDVSASEDFKNAFLSNMDAGLPVMLGIAGGSGGHSIIGDGYGYSGDSLYIHLNYGWGGGSDAWYCPPALNAGGMSFQAIDSIVYNIYTNQPASSVIYSGRVLDCEGRAVRGATVMAVCSSLAGGTVRATTDERGIYALYLPPVRFWNAYATYQLSARAALPTVMSAASTTERVSPCVSVQPKDYGEAGYGGALTWEGGASPSVSNRSGIDLVLPAVAIERDDAAEAPVTVPVAWLSSYYPSATNFRERALADAANGVNKVWEAFVAGFDPTDADRRFVADIGVTNGDVYVSWSPDLNAAENGSASGASRYYKVKGKTNLTDDLWEDAVKGHRFFRVEVDLPRSGQVSDRSGQKIE